MKKIRFLFAFLIIISFLSASLLSVEAKKKKLEANYYSPVFDATYYATKYPDLVASLGNSQDALLNHFVNCGMNEGRQGSAEFDVQYYKNTNPDLAQVYGNDLKQYYIHYINNGKAEGRKGTGSATSSPSTASTSGVYVGQVFTFGAYEQDGNESNGKEPIEWIVLNVNGNKALVISKYILDTVPYYREDVDDSHIVTWSNSYLRYWMNNDFMNSAFSTQEQARIALTTLENPNPSGFYDLKGRYTYYYNDYTASTQDRIFALSYKEVAAYMGVTQLTGSYWGYASPMLMAEATPKCLRGFLWNKDLTSDYYNSNFIGTNYPTQNIGKSGYSWWLRTSGYRLWQPGEITGVNTYTSYALDVDGYGILGGQRSARCASDEDGDYPGFNVLTGCRPAMYIYF